MASKNAILRLAPLIRPKLSRASALRWDRLLELLDAHGRAVLSDVLDALYPGKDHTSAMDSFRQFRAEVKATAEEAEVALEIETDYQTRSRPSDRVVRFKAEDRVTEDVAALVSKEIGDVARQPQDTSEARPRRIFVSYAHGEKGVDTLLEKLEPFLKNSYGKAKLTRWSDKDIQPGEKWLEKIESEMEACDAALLMVSPLFLSRDFITEKELPFLLRYKRVIPVSLKPVPLDGSIKLYGLDERQIFFDAGRKSFSERETERGRDAFALQLFGRIQAVLGERPVEPDWTWERRLAEVVGDVDRSWQDARAESMRAEPTLEGGPRMDAIESLLGWIQEENAPRYCALLGEYGMGKTTTCKALARELLERRSRGEKAPLPIYLDLRYVGESAKSDPTMEDILDRILKKGWKSGPRGARVTVDELIRLAEHENALVIWDGLDEVLVHLKTHQGQMFTRQLYKIAPPHGGRARVLISCRTHYFRTLRDQKAHFRAEDRDDVKAEDYRAFVLLPFTAEQIREYIRHTFPDEDPERVLDMFRSVHNLEEMAERPYTLSLIADREQFAQMERWKAEGRRVTGLVLYRHMVQSWLERDQGKHQLTTDHKQAIMEYVAAELWRAGTRSWSAEELEQWLIDFLEANPRVAAHYHGVAREQLKEDLRTATFLVRGGEDRFRFAHTSLQEFFLAGYLRRALVEGRPEAWVLPKVSPETLDFLGQWLEDEKRFEQRERALMTLADLRLSYRRRASELAFAYSLVALRKEYPEPAFAGTQLPGADLSDWEIAGTAQAPLVLAGINLNGADLGNSRWRYCNLAGAIFDGATGLWAEWRDCSLSGSSWKAARLEAAIFRDCELTGSNFQCAAFDHTQLLGCDVRGIVGLPGSRPGVLLVPSGGLVQDLGGVVSVTTGHTDRVNSLAWSPNGERIVSASDDRALRIWEARTGKVLTTLSGHSRPVRTCAWSPDGEWIVSGSDDWTLRIWEARTGKVLATLSGHDGPVNSCAWSPDGKRIVSGSSDRTLRIWEAWMARVLATLSGHEAVVRSCAWSPNGERIVSGSGDGKMRIWEAATGKALAELSGHRGPVRSCAWSPDGERIASGSRDGTLRIWEPRTGKALATLSGHEEAVWSCAWSPDRELILSGSDDMTLRIWEARTGKVLATLSGHQGPVRSCAWSRDGERIVSGSDDMTLRIWEVRTGKALAELSGHRGSVGSCAWSPDGERIVSGSRDGTLRTWEARTGKMLVKLSGHEGPVSSSAWSRDGDRIVSGSYRTLRIWDARTGKALATLSGHEAWVYSCAWSPDGDRIVSASHDKTVRIWEARIGKAMATLAGHRGPVRSCAWSPDGERTVSGSDDRTLRIWDARRGEVLATLSGHEGGVSSSAWSPDGDRIVSASDDQTLRIWDARRGEVLATLSGHEGAVSSSAWSPDGERIVSGSWDGTLRIWEARTGKALAKLSGHEAEVSSCAWSPDGKRIVSGSWDGTLRIWDTATGAQLAPTIYNLRTRDGEPSWCAVDHAGNCVVGCDAEAWQSLGWIVNDAETGWPEWVPAETFGPLPVVESEHWSA